MTETGYRLTNASVMIGGRTLLEDLSLTLEPGKVHGIIGRNGAGKSTLVRLLAGLQPAAHGAVTLDGVPIDAFDKRAFARKAAAMPQSLPSGEGLTVRELAALGRYPWHGALGRISQADHQHIDDALSLTGLQPLAKRPVATLSGGERQRAWLAMMIAHHSTKIHIVLILQIFFWNSVKLVPGNGACPQ